MKDSLRASSIDALRKSAMGTTVAVAALALGLVVVGFVGGLRGVSFGATAVGVLALGVLSAWPALASPRQAKVIALAPTLSVLAALAASLGTGGAASVLTPLFGIALVSLVDVREAGPRRIAAAAALLAVAALALGVPSASGDAATLASPYRDLALALVLAWNVVAVVSAARRIELLRGRALAAMDTLRDDRLHEALAQARRLQSVGAKVAHELKNPLAAIKGLVQLVGRSSTDDRAKERIAVVQSEIDRMEIILGDYLSYARPLEDLMPGPVRVADVVKDVVQVLSARAETAGIRLGSSAEQTATPLVIEADRRRLKEAMINLVSNAIEATPSGGRVAVRVARGDGSAVIEVEDTGRGMSESDLERLGQSYFTTREGGTGLGFVLARSAITQHHGTLDVTSVLGKGTTMRIVLPEKQPKRDDSSAEGKA